MDPDDRKDLGILLRQMNGRAARLKRGADGDDPGDAGFFGPTQTASTSPANSGKSR